MVTALISRITSRTLPCWPRSARIASEGAVLSTTLIPMTVLVLPANTGNAQIMTSAATSARRRKAGEWAKVDLLERGGVPTSTQPFVAAVNVHAGILQKGIKGLRLNRVPPRVIIPVMPSKVVHAACPHDCPDACGVLITVDDLSGKATKIQGDPAHPVTRGFLCAKVAKYLDRVYSPDRLLYPMKRRAPKGEGGLAAFERITWEAALAEIAQRLQRVSDEFGPEAVLPYSYGGTLGALG